jgi:hypothetical protein
MKDYYKILEIEFGADALTIKKAYRRLALIYHPDKNKATDASIYFIELTEAYEILTDNTKRSEYDYLFKKHFVTKDKPIFEEQKYQEQQKTWTEYGQRKGREYSNMPYDDFISRILDEIKIGTSYIPNIFTIAIVGVCAIVLLSVLPKAFSDNNGGMGLFMVIMIFGLAVLAYHLYKVMAADYSEERKRKIKNK